MKLFFLTAVPRGRQKGIRNEVFIRMRFLQKVLASKVISQFIVSQLMVSKQSYTPAHSFTAKLHPSSQCHSKGVIRSIKEMTQVSAEVNGWIKERPFAYQPLITLTYVNHLGLIGAMFFLSSFPLGFSGEPHFSF